MTGGFKFRIDSSVMVVVVVVGVAVVVVDVVSVIVAVVVIASGTVDNLQDNLEPAKDHQDEQIRKFLVDKDLLVKSNKTSRAHSESREMR